MFTNVQKICVNCRSHANREKEKRYPMFLDMNIGLTHGIRKNRDRNNWQRSPKTFILLFRL